MSLKKIVKLVAKVVVIGAALCVFSIPVYAEILLGVTKTSPSIYGGANYAVDWNGGDSGGTYQYFQTSEPNTKVVIRFNAECALLMAGSHPWVGIDTVVNSAGNIGPTLAGSSPGDSVLCSGSSTTDRIYRQGEDRVNAMTQTTIILPQAGQHSVKVRVKGQDRGIAR